MDEEGKLQKADLVHVLPEGGFPLYALEDDTSPWLPKYCQTESEDTLLQQRTELQIKKIMLLEFISFSKALRF